MILDYDQPIDEKSVESLTKYKRWLSEKLANYICIIQERMETDKYFTYPQWRAIGTDYKEAVENIELVKKEHFKTYQRIKSLKK